MRVDTVFDFDAAEHYRALRAVTRLTVFRFVPWIAGGMAASLVLVCAWRVSRGETIGDVLPGMLPYLVLLAFWAILLPMMQRRAARRLPRKDASLVGPQTRSIDADGYHSRGNDVALDIPWKVMHRVIETDEFFLFFVNKQCAYYIPQRSLSDSQTESVRTLLRGAMAGRAQLK